MPEASRRALAVILVVYASVALLAVLSRHSWLVWALCLPLIGGLQNHLLLLHHEGAHGLLHPQRFWNDFLANVFCGYPFFESLAGYRRFHFAHHRHATDGNLDPEIPFYRAQGYQFVPLPLPKKVWLAALDLSGYHWLQFFFAFLRHSREGSFFELFPRREWLSLGVFFIAGVGILVAGGGSLVLWSWIVPQMTVTFYFAKLRGYREHGARTGRLETCTRDHHATALEQFFIFPLNAHLHLTHHRQPGVAWFRLRTREQEQ